MRLNAKTVQGIADALRKRSAEQNGVSAEWLPPWDEVAEAERHRWIDLTLVVLRAYDEAMET
jgi:hypothetical protein